MATAEHRLPVSLLTGFLGSGKTTLLNALLRDPAMAGCAVLINEVGAVGIDHLLVETISEDIQLLESGCLCCTVRGDLSRSLRDLFMRRLRREISALDRIVIETSGLADPAPVVYTLMHDFFLAERFQLAGVIATADVRHVHWQLGQHEEAVRQIAMADRIVLTKCDLASEDDIESAAARVRSVNPAAQQMRSSLDSAPSTVLADLNAYDPARQGEAVIAWLGAEASREQERLRQQQYGFGSAPALRHDERVSSYVLYFSSPFTWVQFSTALELIQSGVGDRILRLKGLLNVIGEDAPRVVHAVRHERYPTSSLDAWPDDDRRSRLVFIVRDIPRAALVQAFAEIWHLEKPLRGSTGWLVSGIQQA